LALGDGIENPPFLDHLGEIVEALEDEGKGILQVEIVVAAPAGGP
jgi:hypothetical protein